MSVDLGNEVGSGDVDEAPGGDRKQCGRESLDPLAHHQGDGDAEGKARLQFRLAGNQPMPGKLTANFKTRVFERGGDFSTDNQSLPYNPYKVYAGIRIPENKYGEWTPSGISNGF